MKYINLTSADDTYSLSGKLVDSTTVRGKLGNDRIVDWHEGPTPTWLYGDEGNDVLIGNAWTVAIQGGAGNDFIALKGLTGKVSGGAGHDTVQLNTELYDILGDQGVVYLGSGKPTAALLAEAGLTYDPAHFFALATGSTVERVQTAIHGEGIHRGGLDIIGDNVANVSRGGAAANVLQGAGGNDTLFGFGGDDRLYGGGNDDTLNGGIGADILSGGSGNDILFADAGDIVSGGTGRDQIVATHGSFTVTDFTKGQDQISLVGTHGVRAGEADHIFYESAGVSYQIGLGGAANALGLSIGHAPGSDILF